MIVVKILIGIFAFLGCIAVAFVLHDELVLKRKRKQLLSELDSPVSKAKNPFESIESEPVEKKKAKVVKRAQKRSR